MDERILWLDETDSTNSRLKELACSGAAGGSVVIAERQTGGRGRMGRPFSSPEGGLYLSYLYRASCLPPQPGCITACAAVAACEAIEQVCGVRANIKWVNDLLLHGRKICGILCESVAVEQGFACVVGLGLNVNTLLMSFPPELRSTVGSLLSITGRGTDIDELACALIAALDKHMGESCLEQYRRRCITPGQWVSVTQAERSFSAFAESIADDYSLVVRLSDGHRERLSFGEVSTRL